MKRIGFIGTYDKSDLLIYLAKILTNLNYKVLVVDTSYIQKMKYIIPSINPTKSYITNFEEIDFAIGFENWNEIEKYLGIIFDTNDEKINEDKVKNSYDYVLLDIDSAKMLKAFEVEKFDNNYFVGSFDLFSLNKGMNIFGNLQNPIKITKILFSYDMVTKEEEEYLNNVSLEYKINWNDYALYFQIFNEDLKAIQENQRLEKIRFKRLSSAYKDSLSYVVQDLNRNENVGKIKKMMKE